MDDQELRQALGTVLAGEPVGDLADAVEALIARYRTAQPATSPILGRAVDVLAYAAYRMPATNAAVRTALAQAAQAVPRLRPTSLLDLGGGTGGAAWAATDVFADLREVTVLDQVPAALDLGRRIGAHRPALATARWEVGDLGGRLSYNADLVSVSYVLGELTEAGQAALVEAAAGAARMAVAVIEPGTPAGYGRVLAARQLLLSAGWRVVAPCPHQQACPLRGDDWCHFVVRVNRSALHRRVKGAELGYEDEKFSYVVAVPGDASGQSPAVVSRVLRRPTQRKGLVALRLCTSEGTAADETVSKRQGERYRAARDVSWGDPWPSPDAAHSLPGS